MNSKSYIGINIDTDHKMVIASMILDDYEIARRKTKGEPKIDISIFTDVDNQNRYRNATNILTFLLGMCTSKFKILVEQCKKADGKISGKREKVVSQIQ